MLQQILNDMYIEPELVAELDEDQKQILFCKMRAEQVRRWKAREEQNEPEDFTRKRKEEGGKKVSFLMGGDGEPAVVVLGSDADVDAILQERAKRQAEMEGEALRRAAEEELDKLVRVTQSTVKAMELHSHRLAHTNHQLDSKISDPTRDAVVRSLQEATLEMEAEMRALELQEREGLPRELSPQNIPLSERPTNVPPANLAAPLLLPTPSSASSPSSSLTTTKSSSFISLKPDKDSVNSFRQSPPDCHVENGGGPEIGWKSSLRPHISVAPYVSEKSEVSCSSGVAAQIEQFERLSESSLEALKTATLERAKNHRQREILDNLRHQVETAKNQVSDAMILTTEKEEVAWREQERRAKEAERRIREIARRAREEHRRTTSSSSSTSENGPPIPEDLLEPSSPGDSVFHGDINGNIKTPPDDFSNNNLSRSCNGNLNVNGSRNESSLRPPRLRPYRPVSKEAVIEWFQEEELPKGVGLDRRRSAIEPWFHGIISRVEAERILDRREFGSFLVRVSERIWGYAVSYKAPDRCRHYLIDAIGGRYAFLGAHQNTHRSLGNLIHYHRKEYITTSGKELLDKPIGQVDLQNPDYLELFVGTNYFSLVNSKK